MSLIAECEAMVGQGAVWREIPDSFDEFVTSPRHLRLGPLYPRQRAAVIELIGTDATRIFEDPYNLPPEQVARRYQTGARPCRPSWMSFTATWRSPLLRFVAKRSTVAMTSGARCRARSTSSSPARPTYASGRCTRASAPPCWS